MYILVLKYAFLRVSVAIDALMLSPQMETVVCSFSPGGDGQVWLLCATKPVPEATGTKVTPGTLTWVLQLVFQLGMEPVPIAVVLLGQRLKACSWKNKLPSKSASIVGWLQELRWGRGYTLALEKSFERTQIVHPNAGGCDICELSDSAPVLVLAGM